MTRGSPRHTMNHRAVLDLFGSSHQRCSVKKGVLKTFANFTGKKAVLESLFNKVAGLQACNFIKKTLQH